MYRDDYEALQARADATQRNLEELRASTSQDKDKIAILDRELAATTKELKALRQKLGLAPKNPGPTIAVGLVVLLCVGAGVAFFSFNARKLDAKEAMLDARFEASMQEVAKVTIAKTMKESCTPVGQGVVEASNIPFVVIERPEGCFPRKLPVATRDLVLIRSEEEFQEHYYCPDKSNKKDEERPSGLDFKRFRLVVAYGRNAKPKAAFVVTSQSKIVAGIQPVTLLCTETEGYQTVEFLIPVGDEPVEVKSCMPIESNERCF